jgi:hypothetical protein
MDSLTQLQPHLRPREQLLWHGSPDPGVWLTPAGAMLDALGQARFQPAA